MARCTYCGTTILFGGVTDAGMRFCNENCHKQGFVLTASGQLPDDLVEETVREVHEGACPQCGGEGPIDVHTSHIVWSALVLTSWHSRPKICCRSCGIKSKLGGAAMSAVAGWWGFPWGLIATPIQIGRNVYGLFTGPDPTAPSDQLQTLIRVNLAAEMIAASERQQDAPS